MSLNSLTLNASINLPAESLLSGGVPLAGLGPLRPSSAKAVGWGCVQSVGARHSGLHDACAALNRVQVTTAALKAYGSPSVRGMPRPPPSPAPSHPIQNPLLFNGMSRCAAYGPLVSNQC
jgi:hypothetical protein